MAIQPRSKTTCAVVLLILVSSWGSAQEKDGPKAAAPEEPEAPLFSEMGDHHHPIATDSTEAQRYFDQGLVLAMGFNHAEAARSFRAAQQLDPDCAMAYWGEALVLGPNINAVMSPDNVPKAWKALQESLRLKKRAMPRHRSYIDALAARYEPEPRDDRSELDKAYADAMRKVARAHPEDYDAQSLFAEALMDTTPWDYWREDGEPKEVTREILRTLETVLARAPEHPLANHLYIHAVEAEHPEWAVACADRIGDLVPDAGHLVHMPSHIYIRVARYADANEANERAVQADQSYLTQCHAQGVYALGYVPHNQHFLWFGKAMTGEKQDCLEAARLVRDHVDRDEMREPGLGALQHYDSLPSQTYVRFGMWDEALSAERPADDLKYPLGIWHFARGMAHARTGDVEAARGELEPLADLASDEEMEKVTIWEINTARSVLRIAEEVLRAAIEEAGGDLEGAAAHLRAAVEIEDELKYDEPPTWSIPCRQLLGAVLLEAGELEAAETVYRADLDKYPGNGWSLHGLAGVLERTDRKEEAARVREHFEDAWRHADVELDSSRF